jgi:hypothetical protein
MSNVVMTIYKNLPNLGRSPWGLYRVLGMAVLLLGLGVGMVGCSGPDESVSDEPDAAVPESPVASDEAPENMASEETATEDMAAEDMTEVPEAADFEPIDLAMLPDAVSLTGADPEAIALDAFGLTEGLATDGGEGAEQTVETTIMGEEAIVVITQMGLLDDSVQGMRYRVELEAMPDTDSTQWELISAGRQYVCWPGRGAQDWSSELCL